MKSKEEIKINMSDKNIDKNIEKIKDLPKEGMKIISLNTFSLTSTFYK